MNYYCDICDKTIKHKPKKKRPNCFSHIQYEKSVRIKRTNKNPNLFDVNEISKNFIIDHKEKFDIYLVKCAFKLNFNK